ncbi:MAG: TonB-dependent receptor [bacterium]|nr:TonB-dependent receptor [bacterium]
MKNQNTTYKIHYVLLITFVLSNVSFVKSQNTLPNGRIKGFVISEEENTPLEFANVWINALKIGTVSNAKGFFEITGLADGSYSLAVSLMGYQTTSIMNFNIEKGQSLDLGNILLKNNTISLSEVVISPGSYSIMESIKPNSGLTLSEENIKNMAWAEDITRAVSRLPGISASDYSSKFAIRGGEADQVLISLDGMELYEPFHQRDFGGGLFSIVDIEAVRGIDLMTGGFSAENGNRLSGAFAMKTKHVQADQRHLSAGVSIMNARLYADGKFAKNKGSYLFSARRGMLDLTLKALGNNEYFPNFYDGLMKVEYQLSDKHTLSFHLLHAADKAFFNPSPEGDAFEEFHTKQNSTYSYVTLKSYYSKNLSSRTLIYGGNINHNRKGDVNKYEDSDKGTFTVKDIRAYSYLGIKQDWNWEAFEKLQFKFGFDAKELNAKYDYENSIHELRVNAKEELYYFDRALNIQMNPSGEQIGSYFTTRFKILPKLIAETGIRYDYASYTGDKNWSPRASLVYAFTKSTFLRGGWGYYYQTQFINNIDVNNGVVNFKKAGLAKHYVLGFEHLFKNGISLRAEAYYKDLSNISPLWQNMRDHLETFPESRNDNALVIFNGITSKGVELFLRYDQGKKISWWFSYALANATDNVKDIQYDGLLTKRTGAVPRLNNQRHTIYADINYRPTKSWHFSASWQYYIGWPRTTYTYRNQYLPNGDIHFYQVHGDFNGTQYPSYHRLDLRANKTFKTKHGDITAFLHLVNVYNRKNLKKFDLDPRDNDNNLSIDANGNYVPTGDHKYWLGLLPVVGVKWEIGKE